MTAKMSRTQIDLRSEYFDSASPSVSVVVVVVMVVVVLVVPVDILSLAASSRTSAAAAALFRPFRRGGVSMSTLSTSNPAFAAVDR
jgi:hypothetical protein